MAESVKKPNTVRSEAAGNKRNGVPKKPRSSVESAPEKERLEKKRTAKPKPTRVSKSDGPDGPDRRPDLPRTAEIRPLRPVNAFEEALEQILRWIKLGLVLPGDRLLSERELALRFGVSRPTVREAIRALSQRPAAHRRDGLRVSRCLGL
jgi:hypothetical protein